MASGRKNRGSRHRSHKQHHKQKVEDFVDSDSEPSLHHGPLPEPDSCSPWRMEPLPPHVEGPSLLKPDMAENADPSHHGFSRKIHQDLQKGSQNIASKRRKDATPELCTAGDASASNPPSLDRWDGGQSHGDDFDFDRDGSQVQDYVNSKLGNGMPIKELKNESEGKSRKGKSKAIAAEAAIPNAGQVEADVGTRLKNRASRRRDFSEFMGNEMDRSNVEIDGSSAEHGKGSNSGIDAVGDVKAGSRKAGAAKRWEKGTVQKDFATDFQHQQVVPVDASVIESERKRGKTSEAQPKAKKVEEVLNIGASEVEHLRATSDAEKGSSGTGWVLQNDHRNLELEKELENRIRRRREESGDRDRRKDEEKGKDARRHHYQEDDRIKGESRSRDEKHRDEKHRHEKYKDDGSAAEKERSESKYRDEAYRTGKLTEDKQKEEKLKLEKERDLRRKADKDRDQKAKIGRDREEAIEGTPRIEKYRDERPKDEERDMIDNRDLKIKENKSRDSRVRDKDKDAKHKEERHQEANTKEEVLKVQNLKSEEHFDAIKEEKDSGEYRRARERDKDDRLKFKDRSDKFDKYKEEKLKDDKERGGKQRVSSDRDGILDHKSGYEKKKNEKEQDDSVKQRKEVDRDIVVDKVKSDKQKNEKDQEGDNRATKLQRDREKVDRDGISDQKSSYDKKKNEKEQDDNGRQRKEADREVVVEKGKYDKQKSDRDQEDDNRASKLQRERDKAERPQDVNAAEGREKDQRPRGTKESGSRDDSKRREDKIKDEVLQVLKDRDGKLKDEVIKFKKHERGSRHVTAGAEGSGFGAEGKVQQQNLEEWASPLTVTPRSPSPTHISVHEKTARRAEPSISVSSSSGTRRPRERSRRVTEHADSAAQQHVVDEEVRSWETRSQSRNPDEKRGRSWSPEKFQDSQKSPSPRRPRHEEASRRGSTPSEDSAVPEREHRRFFQGGGPTKVRRLDEASRERSERLYQGPQSSRLSTDRMLPSNRMSGPSGLLPPPPPFRPGIDNPAVLGTASHGFEEGPGPRDAGRYDRKSGGPFRRSEMLGPGDSWRGVAMGNWNAQNQGHGPGNMFPPYGSGGFFGMGQQVPVPPFFGRNSGRPSADMGFGGRFHMGDGTVGYPGHAPGHGHVMGWHRSTEADDSRFPIPGPLEVWEGQGMYLEERQRFGLPEWEQGFPALAARGWERAPDPWQSQAGEVGFGFNNPHLQREGLNKGRPGEGLSVSNQDLEQIEVIKEEEVETKGASELFPPQSNDVVPRSGLKSSIRARNRMQMLLQGLGVSRRLAGGDLYKQYLSLLPPSEAKIREAELDNHSGVSHESVDEDLEFEVDPKAQDLLTTADSRLVLLPSLRDGAYKEALEVYHRPAQQNRVQKSVVGSFLLPVDSPMIKMPSLEGQFIGDVEAGDPECLIDVLPDKDESDFFVTDDVELTKEAALSTRADESVWQFQGKELTGTVESLEHEGVQADGVASLKDTTGKSVMGEIQLEGLQAEPVTLHVSLAPPMAGEAEVDINITTSLNIADVTQTDGESVPATRQDTDISLRSCDRSAESHRVENVEALEALATRQVTDSSLRSSDGNAESHPIENFEALDVQGVDSEGHSREVDILNSEASDPPNNCIKLEEGLEAAGDSEVDDMKGKSRPQNCPEKGSENTHLDTIFSSDAIYALPASHPL